MSSTLPTGPNTPPNYTGHGLAKVTRYGLFAAPVALILAAYGGGVTVAERWPSVAPEVVAHTPDGAALYTQNCATCHGERGDGNGVTILEPRARYFGFDKYKFATTTNAIPSDADLLGLLKRGLPGSAMPAFPQLADDDLVAIIDHIRFLTRKGQFEAIRKKADKDEEDFYPAEAIQRVVKNSTPGTPLTIPTSFPTPTEASLAHGKKVFQLTCATCHGPEGRGDGPQVATMKNEDGTPNKPRDLTRGLFKGGAEPQHLYARIMLGIPGTPMPASNAALKQDDVFDLIGFIYSLSKDNKPEATTIAAR